MAVTLTGANGLFTRLGKVVDLLNKINTHRSTTLTTETEDINDQYTDARRDLVDNLFTQAARYRASGKTFLTQLQSLAEDTVIQMVFDDAAITPQTLVVALTELIRQMEDSSDDVDASTVSASVAYGASNNGDGVVIVSVVDGKVKTLENAFDETITATVTSDSQSDGLVEGQETFTCVGDATADELDPEWPLGSGANTDVDGSTAQVDATSNLLVNSGFEVFTTTDVADNWDYDVGTAGVSIFEAGSPNQFLGDKCLRILGDGAELTSLNQVFTLLEPNTVYAIDLVTKVSAVPATGVLRLSLKDSSNVIIQDDSATDNKFNIDLTAESTSYAHHNHVFITPRALPASYKLVAELTTALEAGKSVYIDEIVLTPMTQLYDGGPFVAVVPGASRWVNGDVATITVTNNYAGAFQSAFERLFNMRDKGLILPSDTGGTETVNDSLIS